MSVAPMTFSELTDYGVLEKPHLSELLDSQDLKVLEERFLTKGTVIVMKDKILQATQIRGSQTAREVWFAPSSLSRTVAAAAKVKASEVYSAGGFSHVFMNVLGATFMTREGGAADPAGSMHFKVVLLPAPASAKDLESVHVVAMLEGSPVGQPIVVPAKKFFLEYVPAGQVPVPGGDLGASDLLGTFDVAVSFPEFFSSLTALGAGAAVQYSGAAVAAYAAVALQEPLATSREEASAAGDKLEQVIADAASPARASLKLLHRVGAVLSPRPGLGGRVIRQCCFPDRLPLSYPLRPPAPTAREPCGPYRTLPSPAPSQRPVQAARRTPSLRSLTLLAPPHLSRPCTPRTPLATDLGSSTGE